MKGTDYFSVVVRKQSAKKLLGKKIKIKQKMSLYHCIILWFSFILNTCALVNSPHLKVKIIEQQKSDNIDQHYETAKIYLGDSVWKKDDCGDT